MTRDKADKAIEIVKSAFSVWESEFGVPNDDWSEEHKALDMAIEALKNERPKGHWISEGDGYADDCIVYDTWYCSECDHCEEGEELALPNFCPDCGTDMRGEN